MGQGKSKGSPTAVAVDNSAAASGSVPFPDELRPSAGVIGAGMAGIHAALELEAAGFDVTVYDSRPSDRENGASNIGNSRFSVPFVTASEELGGNSSPVVPFVTDASVTKAFLHSCMRPFQGGSIGFRLPLVDVMHPAWGSATVLQWLYDRTTAAQDRALVAQKASLLAAESRVSYEKYAVQHAAEFEGALSDGELFTESNGNRTAEAVLAVDVTKWNNGLRQLAAKRGIDIKYGTTATQLRTTWVNGTEHGMFMDARTPQQPTVSLQHDLYVLACGPTAGYIAGSGLTLPLLSFRGWSLTIPSTHQAAAAIRNACQASPIGGPGGVQFGPALWASWSADEPLRVSGLFGNPARRGEKDTVNRVAADMGRYLKQQRGTAASTASTALLTSDDLASVDCETFRRTVTPDGLPFVGRLGFLENVFVCTGFGDHEVAWAPAAAARLRQSVEKKLDERTNPFSVRRFGAYSVAPQLQEPSLDRSAMGYWDWLLSGSALITLDTQYSSLQDVSAVKFAKGAVSAADDAFRDVVGQAVGMATGAQTTSTGSNN